MKRLKPARLNFGDTIGLIAPASPPQDPQAIDRAVAALEKFGFKVKLGENVRARNGFLAGGDAGRAADVMAMFADPAVNAIFCLRGGYGSVRILDLLDFKIIRRHPKIFVGYSDLTSFHGELQKQTNLISFHAPMAGALAAADLPEFTRATFFRTLMEAKPAGSICAGYDKKDVSTLRCGVAEGRLLGGNLSVLCADIGTRFEPKFSGRILFLEDVGERPYRLDRLLTQLLNAGVFDKVAGVAIGVNHDCEEKTPASGEYTQSSADVFAERLSSLKIPVVTGLPFGHVELNAALPVGAKATLDGDLIITEAAVS